jgi:hypothetical protein
MCTLLYFWLTVVTELRNFQDRRFTFNVTLKRVRVTIFAFESSNTYSECVSIVFPVQHAKPMRIIIPPSVAYKAITIFPLYDMIGTNFGK